MTHPNNINEAILKAFGIKAKDAVEVVIKLRAGMLPEVVVTSFCSDEFKVTNVGTLRFVEEADFGCHD
jgi:DNA-binding protein